MSLIVWVIFGLTALPALMSVWNLFLFRPLPRVGPSDAADLPPVSVLIPARNEASCIDRAVGSVLANEGVNLELVVLDDHSTDGTAAVVKQIAQRDSRVRCELAPPVPDGWCGKQHACDVLSRLARYEHMVWLDADVQLACDALARMVNHFEHNQAQLISGFPKQITGTWLEKLVVPLIHLVLLGYLPIGLMRRLALPGLGTGCGQLVMSRRPAYEAVGGHAAVKASMHEGVTLPPIFRSRGYMTDIFDAGDLAQCRMYRSAGDLWQGFTKNAVEGLASPTGIWIWTLLLIGGHVLPWIMILAWALGGLTHLGLWQLIILWGAWAQTTLLSLGLMYRFEQSWLSALARPLGVSALLLIQWYALTRHLLGFSPKWRGRVLGSG